MFSVDVMSRVPIYEQVIRNVERLVLVGALPPSSRLPSVRQLSVELSVNPNTVQKAYNELCRREVARAVPGKGYYVAPGAKEALHSRGEEALRDFRERARSLLLLGVGKEQLIAAVEEAAREKGEES